MWRSVIVYNGERLSTLDNWLIVTMEDGQQKKIPMEDLYCVVVDNMSITITMPVLVSMARNKVHLIVTDERHLPVAQTLPLNTHYRCYKVMKRQIAMSDEFKGGIWQAITCAKIRNQAMCLSNVWGDPEIVDRLRQFADEVVPHDAGNREGVAAKMFFKNMYGADFTRFDDDKINAALNYGYAILRSGVAKSLVSYGFSCVLGVHHISETNEFNLADDFMEPLRPLVDNWIALHIEDVEEGLSKYVKGELVNLLNAEVRFDNKSLKVRYAIDSMVRSFVTSIETNNPQRLLLPEIIRHHDA